MFLSTRYLLVICAFVALTSSTLAILAIRSRTPLLRLNSSEVDLGTLAPNQVASGQFVIHNDGSRALLISKIAPSCACTVISGGASKIEPGFFSEVKFQFKAPPVSGPAIKQIVVESNDPNERVAAVNLKAFVDAKYDLDPPLLDFGFIEKTNLPITKQVHVTPAQGVKLASELSILTESKDVTTSVVRSDHPKCFDVLATINRGMPVGVVDSSIILRVNDHQPGSRPIEFLVPIAGKIIGDVRAIPETVFLGNTSANQPLHGVVRLSFAAVRQMAITELSVLPVEASKFFVLHELPDGFGVDFCPTTFVGDIRANILVVLEGGLSQIEVPVYASAIPPRQGFKPIN